MPKSKGSISEAQCFRANLGEFIETRRRMLGMSQTTLAKRTGVHQTIITRLETGKGSSASVDIELLASSLEVSAEELHLAMIGLHYLVKLYDQDLIHFIRAIAASDLKSLSAKNLLILMRVETGMRSQKFSITKEMVPGLLAQARTFSSNSN